MVLWAVVGCAADRDNLISGGTPGDQCVEPGRSVPCYTGPLGTKGHGVCASGFTTCTWDLTWGECVGETLPTEDDCTNTTDDDCDGTVDEGADNDGDGWGVCEGDCCDDTSCASNPERVNPGAFEATANTVDDDCDGMIDNPDPGCTSGDPTDEFAYARALDICRTTTEEATGIDQRWGVISVKLTRANGLPLPDMNKQSAIKTSFGVNLPRFGADLVMLSTGAAVDKDDPGFAAWQDGTDMQPDTDDDGSVPLSWLQANGGTLPNAPGCPPPDGVMVVNDPIMLTLELRVPTNASSFSIGSNFMSSEYPEYVCTPFNDFFVMLLDSKYSGEPRNPADGNLAFYTDAMEKKHPVGVNLAKGTGLFRQCVNGTLGCAGDQVSTTSDCVGQDELVGTGFEDTGAACGGDGLVGGGTGWLSTTGNVVPGEIIKLRIAIWDTSDPKFDSVALIDSFQWNIDPTTPGTGGMVPQ
jgi:hypothetical protein